MSFARRCLAALAALALGACASAAESTSDALETPSCGAGCAAIDASADAWFDGSTGGAASDAGAPSTDLHALCGEGCDPDWAAACTDASAPDAPTEAADAASDAADDAAAFPYPAGDAAADAREAGAPTTACHVVREAGAPVSVCEPAGAGASGDPCDSSRDCAAGLGCIVSGSGSTCAPWCCGDPEGCPASTWCAEQTLHDGIAVGAPLRVPACVRAEQCTLLDPRACGAGLACAIVRADGTTACVVPGAGKSGDACPCAAGFVCTRATNRCLKLCHTGVDAECGAGVCQGASAGYPPGFGVCVGGN